MSKKNTKILNPNNPLINNDLKIFVNKVTDTTEFENKFGTILHKQKIFERAKITKIFATAKNRTEIAKNSAIAKNILLWLFYQLEYSQDYVSFDKKLFMKENNVKSIKTVNLAIEELQKNKVIAKSNIKDVYFINPVYFFLGSRVKSYPDNVIEYKPNKK